MQKYLFLICILALLLTACQQQPVEVADAFMSAVEQGDIEAMLSHASDEIVMVTDGGPFFQNEYSGKDALRAFAEENATGGFVLERTGSATVNGNQITYPDRFALNVFKEKGVEWISGKDVLTIEDGKVVRDAWTIDADSIAALSDAATLGVVHAYFTAVEEGNVDAMLDTLSDDIVLVTDLNPFFAHELVGKEEVRAFNAAETAKGWQLQVLTPPALNGDTVTCTSQFAHNDFRAIGVDWVSGTDVLTVKDGKISRHVFTIDDASREKLGAAFAALEAALAPEDLSGTWRFDGGEGVGNVDFRYNPDGTYEMVRYITGSETLWDKGSYTIDGDVVTLTTAEAHYCAVGDSGSYTMSINADGQLESSLIEDVCWRRKPPVEGPMIGEPLTP